MVVMMVVMVEGVVMTKHTLSGACTGGGGSEGPDPSPLELHICKNVR